MLKRLLANDTRMSTNTNKTFIESKKGTCFSYHHYGYHDFIVCRCCLSIENSCMFFVIKFIRIYWLFKVAKEKNVWAKRSSSKCKFPFFFVLCYLKIADPGIIMLSLICKYALLLVLFHFRFLFCLQIKHDIFFFFASFFSLVFKERNVKNKNYFFFVVNKLYGLLCSACCAPMCENCRFFTYNTYWK